MPWTWAATSMAITRRAVPYIGAVCEGKFGDARAAPLEKATATNERASMAFVRKVAVAMHIAVFFPPALVYGYDDASWKVGIWVYIGIATIGGLVLAAVIVISMRRHINPHTGLPSRIRRRKNSNSGPVLNL